MGNHATLEAGYQCCLLRQHFIGRLQVSQYFGLKPECDVGLVDMQYDFNVVHGHATCLLNSCSFAYIILSVLLACFWKVFVVSVFLRVWELRFACCQMTVNAGRSLMASIVKRSRYADCGLPLHAFSMSAIFAMTA